VPILAMNDANPTLVGGLLVVIIVLAQVASR
jgi:hypothetical protein